jgi:hypothetical protein
MLVAGLFHLLLWPSIDVGVIRFVLGASHVTLITTWRTEGSYRKMMNFTSACVGSEGRYMDMVLYPFVPTPDSPRSIYSVSLLMLGWLIAYG